MKFPRSPESVGSLNLTVFHDWNPERLFMIVTVYADESGTHAGSPVMVLGGRLARLGQWMDFDLKWRRLLKREGLGYFHGKEYRAGSKEFAGWGDDDREKFMREAQKIVGKHTLYGFATTLDHDEYKDFYRAVQRPRKLKIDSKYGLCFRIMLLNLPRIIARSLPLGDLQVNFVLESGDPGSGDAKPIFDEAKARAPDDLARILGTLTYGGKKEFPGLQAADLIAFGAYRAEQTQDLTMIKVTPTHTIAEARKLVSYKSQVIKFPITPAVMNEMVTKGIADLEERKRHWQAGRKEPQPGPQGLLG